MRIENDRLRQIIKELGVVLDERLESAFKFAEKANRSLADVLVESDLISDDHMGQIIAKELGYAFIDLDTVAIPADVLEIVPRAMASVQQVIPFSADLYSVKVAMVNPGNERVLQLIEKKTGRRVVPYLTTKENIINTLVRYRQGIQQEFSDIIQESISEVAGAGESDLPIVKIVDTIIEYAFDNKASDIHIEPNENKTLVRFRIDGLLHDIITLPRNFHDLVVMRIKIMGRLRTDEHRSAQDGKLQAEIRGEKLDIRVSIIPVVDGEKVVLRLLSEHSRQFSLEELGMNTEDLLKVKREYSKPYGMVLATGPTGSGKTTTLYAIIKILNRREVNIATIEDPVEYDIEGVNQVQVDPKTNLTFAAGLRSILRQDPDIIMVGEIRDQETADIAVNSAMTGHLVLSSLHTNDAPTALPRFLEMNIEPFIIASTVNLIIAQRLVRRNCAQCIASEEVSVDIYKAAFPAEMLSRHVGDKTSVRSYRSKGCPLCGQTGYTGRIGIFEVLPMTETIRQLIMKQSNAEEIRKQAVGEGMTTMLEDGLKKVLAGSTTIDEVLRATRS